MKETWREGPLAGDPGEGLSTGDFERCMKGSL